MFTHAYFDTARADHDHRLREARSKRLALELRRAQRLQKWADRSARFSCWLAGLARGRSARI